MTISMPVERPEGDVYELSADVVLRGNMAFSGRPWLDVTVHGAIGDGVIDDTAAIQAALDVGRYVLFPPDRTFLLGNVTIPSDRILTGGGTIKKKATSPYALLVSGTGTTISNLVFAGETVYGQPNTDIKLGDGASSVLITGCRFKTGTYSAIAGQNDSIAVPGTQPYVVPVRGVTISNNHFIGPYSRPIYLHSVQDTIIEGNYITGCLHDAIRLRENGGYFTISNNVFYRTGDQTWPDEDTRDAIDAYWSGQKLIVANNIIFEPAYHGLDIKNASPTGSAVHDIIITGNYIGRARYSGVNLMGIDNYDGLGGFVYARGIVVSNNVIEECNQQNTGESAAGGIDLKQLISNAIITGNIVQRNLCRGIYVRNNTAGKDQCRHITIRGNQCINNGRSGDESYGIFVVGSSYVTIDGNQCIKDTQIANPYQTIGILVDGGPTNGYTAVAQSTIIQGNTCIGNTTTGIRTNPGGTRVNGIGVFTNNIGPTERAGWQGSTRLLRGNAVPVADDGAFQQGDVIINTAPAGGTPVVGWTCTVAGTPGTWVAFT